MDLVTILPTHFVPYKLKWKPLFPAGFLTHTRSVKFGMVCFHMLCSLLNVLAHHLWVQFSKSTLFILFKRIFWHWCYYPHTLRDSSEKIFGNTIKVHSGVPLFIHPGSKHRSTYIPQSTKDAMGSKHWPILMSKISGPVNIISLQ